MSDTAVLLSTYNGEKYIKYQLDSLTNQTYPADIIIRDDGSKDATVEIIKKYINTNKNIKLIVGENIGFINSFWFMIKSIQGYKYYALCDQDDIWFPQKIQKSIESLKQFGEKPALCTCGLSYIDSSGNRLFYSPFNGEIPSRHKVFLKSVIPGCTFLFNNSARLLITKYNGIMYSHDWTIYIIMRILGNIVHNKDIYIQYRIHSNNTIGVEYGIYGICKKWKRFFKKSSCIRSKFARDFYEIYKEYIPAEIINDIYILGHYKDNLFNKLKLIFSNQFNGLIFKIYVFLGRI